MDDKMEVDYNKQYELFGHELKIVNVSKRYMGESRITLSCYTHCCTIPNGLEIKVAEHELKLLEKDNKNKIRNILNMFY